MPSNSLLGYKMELTTKLSVYIMPFLLIVISIAIGIIFKNNKSIGNALLLIGFIMHAFPIFSSLLLNISPVELNEAGKVVKRTEGFLTFFQMMVIEVIAYLSITLGFVLNAYTTFTKIND